MKKTIIILTLISQHILSTDCPPQIGDKAPAFEAKSTKGPIKFPEDFAGKWVVFFSHPADFTPVCKTEFKRLTKLTGEFNRLNSKLLGISVDPEYVHELWEQKIEKEIAKKEGKGRKISFPVAADPEKKIVRQYGMIHPKESSSQTVRSVYFIDPKGIIRAIFYYPIANGRDFNEVLRLLQALQTTDAKNVATPEGWRPGKPTIKKQSIAKDILPKK